MEEEEQPPIRLPSDLYLPILDHVHDNAQLAELCGVDRLFLELAREKLYAFVWVRPCMYLAAKGGLPSDNPSCACGRGSGSGPQGERVSSGASAKILVLIRIRKFRLLFRTLNENPEIAEIVRKLG